MPVVVLDRHLVGWLWFRGRRDEALQRASVVLGRDPSDVTSLCCAVRHLRSAGRDEEALGTLKASLAVPPTSVFALRVAAEPVPCLVFRVDHEGAKGELCSPRRRYSCAAGASVLAETRARD